MSEDYGKRIKRAANLMSRSMDAYAARYGLTGTQMSIIDFLGESQNRTQRDIDENPATHGGQWTALYQTRPQGRSPTHHCSHHQGSEPAEGSAELYR